MFRTIALAGLSASALALMTGVTLAAGTNAGDVLTNSFSMSYDTAGGTISIPDVDTVETTVGRRVAFTLTPSYSPSVKSVVPGDQGVDLPFTLTNTSNFDAIFDLDVAQTFPTANGIPLTYDISGAPGTWRVAVIDPLIGPGSAQVYDPSSLNGIAIPADAQRIFLIVASIPDADDLARDDFMLTVRALDETGSAIMLLDRDGVGIDTVFADPDSDNSETGNGGFVVQAPVLSATKTVSVVADAPGVGFNCANDGIAGNGSAYVPGACIEYQITVANSPAASNSAPDIYFLDRLPAGVTFAGATIEINNGTANAFVVRPAPDQVAGEVDYLDPGVSATLRIRATVN